MVVEGEGGPGALGQVAHPCVGMARGDGDEGGAQPPGGEGRDDPPIAIGRHQDQGVAGLNAMTIAEDKGRASGAAAPLAVGHGLVIGLAK